MMFIADMRYHGDMFIVDMRYATLEVKFHKCMCIVLDSIIFFSPDGDQTSIPAAVNHAVRWIVMKADKPVSSKGFHRRHLEVHWCNLFSISKLLMDLF